MQQLRPYQSRALDALEQALSTHRRVLLVAPVGAGKTTLIADKIRRAGRALVVAHRTELIDQCSERLRGFGVSHGIIMADRPKRPYEPVQVGSVQTLARRALPPADVLIFDEAHRAKADSWQRVADAYPKAQIVGFTASPWRLDGKPLSDIFETVVVAATPSELVAAGYLVPCSGFAYDMPDLSRLHKRMGEYREEDSAAAMAPVMGNIVQRWQETAAHLSTVLFAVNLEHSRRMAAAFCAAGVAAEHVDGEMSATQRAGIIARVRSGATRVVCNVNILTEGFDAPRLKCAILARPTLSTALYIQMVGRIRRPWEGVEARLHDHAGCVATHGLPDEDRDYSLTEGLDRDSVPAVRTCPECFAVYASGSCPSCGRAPAPVAEPREVLEAEGRERSLEEVARERRTSKPITWADPGQQVEGRIADRRTVRGLYGAEDLCTLDSGVTFRVTADLRQKLARVSDGSRIRVTYRGKKALGDGRSMHEFTVEAAR